MAKFDTNCSENAKIDVVLYTEPEHFQYLSGSQIQTFLKTIAYNVSKHLSI